MRRITCTLLQRLLQLRLCVSEGVTLHKPFKLQPLSVIKQRMQCRTVHLDEISGAGIKFREQLD
jgi:hypothetical protein